MAFYSFIRIRKLYKITLLFIISLVMSACNTMNVKYLNREEVKNDAFAGELPRYTESKPLSLGAVNLTNSDAEEDELGQLFILQRSKGIYMVETRIKDDSSKRFFFSAGIAPGFKSPTLGFRIEF